MSKQPCLDCGTPIEANRWGRCARCAAPLINANNARRAERQQQRRRVDGRNRASVQRAMREAIERAGACAECGRTEHLQAHYPGGGEHSDNPDDYIVLCNICHGRLSGALSRRRRDLN